MLSPTTISVTLWSSPDLSLVHTSDGSGDGRVLTRLSQSPSHDLDISSGSRTPGALGLLGLFLGFLPFLLFLLYLYIVPLQKNVSESTCGKSKSLRSSVYNENGDRSTSGCSTEAET